MSETLEFVFKTKGVEELKRALADAQRELGGVERKSKEVGTAGSDLNFKLSQIGSTIGMAGQALGRFNTGAGQMLSVIGQAAGAVQSLQVGLGPLGIALGLATTAASLLSAGFAAAEQSSKRMADEIRDRAIPTLTDLIAKAREAHAALTLETRLRAGEGTSSEQAGFADQARQYANLARGRATRAGREGSSDEAALAAEARRAEDVVAFRERLASGALSRERGESAQRRDRERFEQEVEDAEAMGLIHDRRARGRGGRGGDDEGFLEDKTKFGLDNEGRGRGQTAPDDEARALQLGKARATANEGAGKRDQSELDKLAAGSARAARAVKSSTDLMRASFAAVGDAVVEHIGGSAVGAMRTAVDAWLDGSKSFGQAAEDMAKSVIKSLVAESIVQAAVETARGVAALAGIVTAAEAPGHFVAAATWAGIGAVAGGVGLATGAVGGGGAGAAAAGGGRATPSRPSRERDDRGRGGETVVINLNMPHAVVTQAEQGRMLARLERAASRVYGRAA